jgi:hypothetical protein
MLSSHCLVEITGLRYFYHGFQGMLESHGYTNWQSTSQVWRDSLMMCNIEAADVGLSARCLVGPSAIGALDRGTRIHLLCRLFPAGDVAVFYFKAWHIVTESAHVMYWRSKALICNAMLILDNRQEQRIFTSIS